MAVKSEILQLLYLVTVFKLACLQQIMRVAAQLYIECKCINQMNYYMFYKKLDFGFRQALSQELSYN